MYRNSLKSFLVIQNVLFYVVRELLHDVIEELEDLLHIPEAVFRWIKADIDKLSETTNVPFKVFNNQCFA